MVIRSAVRGDIRRLAELKAIAQEMHRQVAPAWFKPPDLDAVAAYFTEMLASDNMRVFVADVAGEGEIQGYVLATIREEPATALTYGGTVVELDQIVVDPAYRGRGLGSALIARVKQLAADVTARRLQLTVWEFNDRARTLFEHEGFSTAMRRMFAPVPH